MKDYGYFDDAKKEYVITNLFPKRNWYNYLWNEEFVADIDQFGFGMRIVRDKYEKLYNFMVADNFKTSNNTQVFIRDNQTGESYSANRNYNNLPFTLHETHVGQGYSRMISAYNGLSFCETVFVPQKGRLECWEIKLKNNTDAQKDISVYPYALIQSTFTFHLAFVKARYDETVNGVVSVEDGIDIPSDITVHYLASDRKPDAYETVDRHFCGTYGSITAPDALKDGNLGNHDSTFDATNALVLQFNLHLKPGEEQVLRIGVGATDSLEHAYADVKREVGAEAFERSFAAMERAAEYDERVRISTGDERVDRRINIWLKRQLDFGKTWTRLWFRGSRDMMQDISAFVVTDPASSREKLVDAMKYMQPNGNYIRGWMPITKTDARDCSTWMISAVVQYIKETGDFSILSEVGGYFESNETDTMMDHLLRAASFLQNTLGESGFVLWGGSDWNDSIDKCGVGGKGESVWLSEAAVYCCKQLAELLETVGETEKADRIRENAEKMKATIRQKGWDKDHFIYGINDDRKRIGSYDSAEGQAYLNPQTWAILAGIVEGEERQKLMDFVEEKLSCPYGYLQQVPAYTVGDSHIGRMTYFSVGCYENGSVYNHGCAFKLVADCLLGRGDQALKTFEMMMPYNEANPYWQSGVEPYAVTNMYIGPGNRYRAGESVMHWVTGTCGWLFRGVVEFMIGLQAEYDGLHIRPCLPSAWEHVRVKRRFRNTCYEIEIRQSTPNGKVTIAVDGTELSGDVLPLFDDGISHQVTVSIA